MVILSQHMTEEFQVELKTLFENPENFVENKKNYAFRL